MEDWTRRAFVRGTTLGAAGVALGCVRPADPGDDPGDDTGSTSDDTAAGACAATAADIEGPFYVPDVPVRSDLDLYDDPGTLLRLDGRVEDTDCAALAGAVVELWQADPDGAYDNTSDEHRYRGQVATEADGSFAFTTLLPGRYLNGDTYRPRHQHLKVHVDGAEVLTTQLYFEGDPFNAGDPWFDPDRALQTEEQEDGALAASTTLTVTA